MKLDRTRRARVAPASRTARNSNFGDFESPSRCMFQSGRHFDSCCPRKMQSIKIVLKKIFTFGGPANNSFHGDFEKSDGQFRDPNVCLKTILLERWKDVSLLLSMLENQESRSRQTKRR